jgi:hypothetical protein
MQIFGAITGADLWTLSVQEDSDWMIAMFIQLMNRLNNFRMGTVIAMGHIQSRYIHARIRQLLKHLSGVCGWAYSADYFGLAHMISLSVMIFSTATSQSLLGIEATSWQL